MDAAESAHHEPADGEGTQDAGDGEERGQPDAADAHDSEGSSEPPQRAERQAGASPGDEAGTRDPPDPADVVAESAVHAARFMDMAPGLGDPGAAADATNDSGAADTADGQTRPSDETEAAAAARGEATAAAAGEPVGTHLSTDCQELDNLLEGGLERDAITLVFGEGGSGKTNLALQCARAATAAGKRVAYVDTEGVSARRLEQVFAGHLGADAERILFFTPYSIGEQEKMVAKTALLRDVGLIVIDSINMHYRLHIEDKDSEKEASASLFKQLHHLTGHARKHRIPILVTGQVYGGEDTTQPFARRVMEHLVKALVRFEKRPDGTRRATILKHRSIEEGRQALFRIGGTGLVGPGERS